MLTKYLVPVVLIAICSSRSYGKDEFEYLSLSSDSTSSTYTCDGVSCDRAATSLCDGVDTLCDSCCGVNATCDAKSGTCPNCGGYCCTREGKTYDSCLDWILPRSHLPFPLLKGLVEGRDVTLPLPLGTSFVSSELNRHFIVDDIRLGLGPTIPTSAERISVPKSTFHASSQIGRVDLWVLPFLNIYGLVGHTRTTGDVDVTVDRFPFPFSPPVTINVPVVLEGPTAGWGATTGIGSKRWFAMLDINQSWTTFSQLDSTCTALVIAPRVGVVIDRPILKGEFHIGAMWQNTDQTVELTVNHPLLGDGLHVQVDQIEPRKWNFLVGGLWALDERFQLFAEGGMGGRSYIISGVTVRY